MKGQTKSEADRATPSSGFGRDPMHVVLNSKVSRYISMCPEGFWILVGD